MANQEKVKYLKEPMRTQSKKKKKKENNAKVGKIQVTKLWLVLVLYLIGWKSGMSILDQSQSKLRQKQNNLHFFWHSIQSGSTSNHYVKDSLQLIHSMLFWESWISFEQVQIVPQEQDSIKLI